MVTGNPLAILKSMKPGETAMVVFNAYNKMRTFTVQLSDYNNIVGPKLNVFVHASSKKRHLKMFLVAVTAAEHDAEMADSNLRNEWRKKLPEEWLNQ